MDSLHVEPLLLSLRLFAILLIFLLPMHLIENLLPTCNGDFAVLLMKFIIELLPEIVDLGLLSSIGESLLVYLLFIFPDGDGDRLCL